MAEERRSLRANFVWTLSGNVVYAACMWGILAVLTKMGSPETVGRFALASAIATPVILFANLQLRPIMASDAEGRWVFSDYVALRLTMLPLAFGVVAIVAYAGYSGPQVAAILVFAAARVVEGLSDLFYGYAQKQERMDLVSRSLVIKGIASLALFALAFRMTGDLTAALAAMALGFLVPLLAFDIPRARDLMHHAEGRVAMRPSWDWAVVGRLAWTALPLGLVVLLAQLRNTIPRTQLESGWGEGELGIFSAMSYLTVVGTMFVTALAQSIIARLSRAYASSDAAQFRRLIGHLLKMGLAIGVGGVLAAALGGREILGLIYSPEYAARQDVFIVVMISGAFLYLGNLLGAPITASGAFRTHLWIQAINILITIGAGLALIPGQGMMGAAWTLVSGAAWTSIGYGYAVRRTLSSLERTTSG